MSTALLPVLGFLFLKMNGWIKMHRQILEHWIWVSNEPYDKRSAFVELIMCANHSDAKIRMNNTILTIRRGQFYTSLLKLSERWKWNKRTVSKFLALLESENMIKVESSKGGSINGTLITIVNYSTYQGGSDNAQDEVESMHEKCTSECTTQNTENKEDTETEENKVHNGVHIGVHINKNDNNNFSSTTTRARTYEENCSDTLPSNAEERKSDLSDARTSGSSSSIAFNNGGGKCEKYIKNENLAVWLESQPASWKEVVCMQLHLSLQDLPELFAEFQREVMAQNKTDEKAEQDIRSHFMNMSRIILTKKKKYDNELLHSTDYSTRDAIRIAANIAAAELEERRRMEAEQGWNPDL